MTLFNLTTVHCETSVVEMSQWQICGTLFYMKWLRRSIHSLFLFSFVFFLEYGICLPFWIGIKSFFGWKVYLNFTFKRFCMYHRRIILIHFMPLISYYTPRKYQKASSFLIFSGNIERGQWNKLILCKYTKISPNFLVWKFIRNSEETVPFHKISTPRN